MSVHRRGSGKHLKEQVSYVKHKLSQLSRIEHSDVVKVVGKE